MARFSLTQGLTFTQSELDFVDVDTSTDSRLYLDPYAIQIRDDERSSNCGDHIRSCFNEVLDALRAGNDQRAHHLLNNLHEPNETFLGQSRAAPRGEGVGSDKALNLATALRLSRAFNTGLLSDISEAELFVANVGPDTISDLTTNIVRGLLAEYTLTQCDIHNIATTNVTDLGPIWSVSNADWHARQLRLPISHGRPVLLMPKHSVRRTISLNSQEFWNHHMIEFLRQEYLDSRSALVQTFKTGPRKGAGYVTKKSVKERHPLIKDDLAAFVQRHPEILDAYKQMKGARGPLQNEDFDDTFDERVFARILITRLAQIAPGNAPAAEYHSIAMGISTFLFYPDLICPVKERELHQGRKRIDIKFTNAARDGFFLRMLQAHQTRSISIPFECKNYTKDVNNPEFDQLTSRFGHQRGFFGIILCRSLEDRQRTVAACRDAANDGRGYILVFEDSDVVSILENIEAGTRSRIDRFLQSRFDEISH
jgi:hypothetical protein